MVKVRFKDVEAFKVLLAERGETLSSFSKSIETDASFIHKVTTRNAISPPYAKKVCAALGKEFADLFTTTPNIRFILDY